MSTPKRKKIYYIPGIISLIFLPIAFYIFSKREILHYNIWAIPIFWTDTAFFNKYSHLLPNFNGQFPPKRNYTEIVFTGNLNHDYTRLVDAQTIIRNILKESDTLNGLHFIFGESATYGTFVGVLDKLRIEGAKTYNPFENSLWFYHLPTDTTERSLRNDCLLCNDVIFIKPEISWWTETKKSLVHTWNHSWQIIILYSCFILTVIVLRRNNSRS